MDNLYTQKVINANSVFTDRFLDTKTLFLYCFNCLPSTSFMNRVDGEKAFTVFKEQYAELIMNVHTYRWYKTKRKEYQFDKTVIILTNNSIVEFDDDYCEIMHDGNQEQFVAEVTALANRFKERQRRQPLEINLVVQNRSRLDLKAME